MSNSPELIRSAELLLGPRGDDLLYPVEVVRGVTVQTPLIKQPISMHAGTYRHILREMATGRKPHGIIPFIFDCSDSDALHLSAEPRENDLCMVYPELAEWYKLPFLSFLQDLQTGLISASFTPHVNFPDSELYIRFTPEVHDTTLSSSDKFIFKIKCDPETRFTLPMNIAIRLSIRRTPDDIPRPLLDIYAGPMCLTSGEPLPITGAIATLLHASSFMDLKVQ